MEDISTNIKKVLIVFLMCFIAVISYIAYFEVFQAPKIVKSQYNRRLWAIRNEVLRGTIYDRNMTALTKSTRINDLTQKREYTGSEMFAHVLGYVDINYGITGLEKKYDSELMNSEQQNIFALFKNNTNEEKVGNNIKTTLNFNLQKLAYDSLGNNKGAIVVSNPRTGEILAMVSKPSFDPNDLKGTWASINSDKNTPLLNRATSGLYPPGSTFKTITAVSALENINNIMNRRIDDNGKLYFNSKDSLSNFNGEVLGNIGIKEAYKYSSNVFFGTIGMELGNSKLKSTAEEFYFNKDLPVDGITVENSRFPEFKSNEKGNIAQSAIGQSKVLATPMEMDVIASTIANDGVMMKPFLVSEVLTPKGAVAQKILPQATETVISKENAKIMKDFMRSVVTDGTGTAADIEGLNVCGKTGTADVSENQSPHAWFIGFAPYENPQVSVSVIVENGGQGGIAAANIASQLISAALKK